MKKGWFSNELKAFWNSHIYLSAQQDSQEPKIDQKVQNFSYAE